MQLMLYELRKEVKVSLLLQQLSVSGFQIRCAFFTQLNKVNLQPQGSGNFKFQDMSYIFAYEDKIRAFIVKIEL